MVYLYIWGNQDVKSELMCLPSLHRKKMAGKEVGNVRSRESLLTIKIDLKSRVEMCYRIYSFLLSTFFYSRE